MNSLLCITFVPPLLNDCVTLSELCPKQMLSSVGDFSLPCLKILSKIGFQLKLQLNSVGIWSEVRGPNQLIELSIDVLNIKWIKYSSGTFRPTLTIGTMTDPFLLVKFYNLDLEMGSSRGKGRLV